MKIDESQLEEMLKKNPHLSVRDKPSWRDEPVKVEPTFSESLEVKGVSKRRILNKTEQAYSDHLEMMVKAGEYQWFKAHGMNLYLADTCWYETDFMVLNNNCEIEIHETKGFQRAAGLVKFKVASSMYPFHFYMVKRLTIKEGGGWSIVDGRTGNLYKRGKKDVG